MLAFDSRLASSRCRVKGDCTLRPHHSHISRAMTGEQDENQEAAFGASRPAAPQLLTDRVFTQQVALHHQPAVGRTVEVRFCPIPAGVEANRPPKRSRIPKAEAENQADGRRRK